MQVRALVALLALTMAITLGVSLTHDAQPQPAVAASAQPVGTSADAASRERDGGGAEAAETADLATDEPDSASTESARGGKVYEQRAVDCRKRKCVALTFDDGPGLDTPRLLKVLARTKTRATFFLVGQMVKARPGSARQIVRRGHEVGVHTMGHPDLTRLSDAWVRWQLQQTKRLITRTTGVRPTLSRPPYGATGRRVLRIQGELGLSEVLWDVDTSDWKIRDARYVTRTGVQRAGRNSVILMHDIRPTTVDAVASMIRGLRRRGFTLVTVSELIGNPVPGRTYFDWRTPKRRVTKAGHTRTSVGAGDGRKRRRSAH